MSDENKVDWSGDCEHDHYDLNEEKNIVCIDCGHIIGNFNDVVDHSFFRGKAEAELAAEKAKMREAIDRIIEKCKNSWKQKWVYREVEQILREIQGQAEEKT